MIKRDDFAVNWVIDFKGGSCESTNTQEPASHIPPFNLYIPQEPTFTPPPKMGKSRYKALDFLQQIQDSCESLKQECRDTLSRDPGDPYEEKVFNISQDIKSLFGIIQEFTQLIQKLEPPAEDPPREDEKNS